jgi:predicted permease
MGIGRYFQRREQDAELAREIEAHIAHETDENVARGMTALEARRRARIKFGSARIVREDVWKWNTIGVLDDLWRDLRYVVRTLRRTPGFAISVILVMALGIGAVTAMFTIVRSVLLKPLPFREPERLVMLYERSADGKFPYNSVAGGAYLAWQREARTFEQLAAWQQEGYNLSASNGQLPEMITGAPVSWNFFVTLGVQPVLGRAFEEPDDRNGADATVMLSWGLWKRRFGGDASLVGKTVQLDGKAYTVIGIMPAWFSYPDAATQAWLPARHEVRPLTLEDVGDHQFRAVARLKPGVTMAQALSEVDAIQARVHTANPTKTAGSGANARLLLDDVVGDYKTPLYALLAATFCVLVIACLNVVNLFVARAAARRKESAIRSALGGSSWRLIREQMMESVVLAITGGGIGLELAYLAVLWVSGTRHGMARAEAIRVDWAVIALASGLTFVSGVIAGVISAWSSRGERLVASLQEASRTHSGGRSKARLRKMLLATEMGLTVVLLIGAGLLLKSYQSLRAVKLGCATENVLTMHISLPQAHYKNAGEISAFFEGLINEVRRLPGVERAGLVSHPPGAGYGGDNQFTVPEHPALPPGEFQFGIRRYADPGYFEAMGIPLLSGRTFRAGERLDAARQAIIEDSFARRYFPSEDPIGRHLRVALADNINFQDFEIVGVVGNTRQELTKPTDSMIYYPTYSGLLNDSYIVVRSTKDVTQLALPIQKLMAARNPDLAVADIQTMEQIIGWYTSDTSFSAELTFGFAMLSLLLASVGLYGVLSYLVAQRKSEIGVRIALGAQRGQVLRLMLADGMQPTALGLVFGLAGGAAAASLIRNLLYGVNPMNAGVFAGVAVVLLAVAMAACLVPAWRASRLDPVRALRMD